MKVRAIRPNSPGPVFYWQRRVGKQGKVFWLVKLRAMVQDAELDGKAVWAGERDPVTVTDPEASRCFMLLSGRRNWSSRPEPWERGGEVFFLDMGEPVRILDLAENLIRLSGLEPGRGVPTEVIGLRPGERLREELVMEEEDLLRTAHERVLMVRNHGFDADGFRGELEGLRALVAARDREGAVAQLRAMAARY